MKKTPIFVDEFKSKLNTPEEKRDFTFDCLDVLSDNVGCDINRLLGEILTLAEVAMPEGQQLKAIKSQIKAAFNRGREDLLGEVIYVGRAIGSALYGAENYPIVETDTGAYCPRRATNLHEIIE